MRHYHQSRRIHWRWLHGYQGLQTVVCLLQPQHGSDLHEDKEYTNNRNHKGRTMIPDQTEALLQLLEDLATEFDDTKGHIPAAYAADRIGELTQDFRNEYGDEQ